MCGAPKKGEGVYAADFFQPPTGGKGCSQTPPKKGEGVHAADFFHRRQAAKGFSQTNQIPANILQTAANIGYAGRETRPL